MSEKIIAKALQECEDWMAKTGGSAKQAASRYPEYASELEEILRTIQRLECTPKPAPSEAFKAAAPTRMANLIQAREANRSQSTVTKSSPIRHSKQQTRMTRRLQPMTWAIIIGLLAAVLTGGGATVYASTDALPGDALYPVKDFVQDVELAFSDDTGDIELLLEDLSGNIEDLEKLADLGREEDILTGLEEYEETMGVFLKTRARVSYDDAGTEESINNRIQSQLELHTASLEKLRQKTQQQVKLQEKLLQAIQLTETGKVYGPNAGGKNEEPGSPNGAGPGEPQGDQTGAGKPEDTGSGGGGQPEDAGSGNGSGSEPNNGNGGNQSGGNSGQGQAGSQENPGAGGNQGTGVCTCIEPVTFCVMGEVQDAGGNLIADGVCTCTETGLLCGDGSGSSGSNGGGNSGGGKP